MLRYQFKFTRGDTTISSLERKFREDLDALALGPALCI